MIAVLLLTPYRWIERLIELQEKRQYSLYVVLVFAMFVGIVRLILEYMLCSKRLYASFPGSLSYVSFYFMNAFLYTTAISFIVDVPWKKIINVVLIGVFVGIFPPLLDTIILSPHNFIYSYMISHPTDWLKDWNLAIYNPEANITPGEAATLWFTILLLVLYVWIKTKSIKKVLISFISGYLVSFFYVTVVASLSAWFLKHGFVPMLRTTELHMLKTLSDAREGITDPSVLEDIARRIDGVKIHYPELMIALTGGIQVLVAQLCYLILNRRLTLHLWRRAAHSLPFALLVVLGAAITRAFHPEIDTGTIVGLVPAIVMGFAVFHAFNTAIVQNDHFDRDADQRGPLSYLGMDDVQFFNVIMGLLIASIYVARLRIGMLLCLFHIVSILYNYNFYRGKRFFPANYKIEGVWGWSAFMIGAYTVIHPRMFLADMVLFISFLVFGGWSLFNFFKDYKDIREDYRAGIQTSYVLLLRRGGSLKRFHLWMRGLMTAGLMVPLLALYIWGVSPWLLVAVVVAIVGPSFYVLGRAPVKSTVEMMLGLLSIYVLSLILLFEYCM